MYNYDAMLEAIEARKDGKDIEWKSKGQGSWTPFTSHAETWDFSRFDYRVKPKMREFWTRLRDDGTFDAVYCSRTQAEASSVRGEIALFRQVEFV